MIPGAGLLPDTLRAARTAARLSQFALSLELGVSQRHISFVEQGRARPSRDLLLAWLQVLQAPLPVRNAALLQAGFAPLYTAAPLQDAALAEARRAIAHLLASHDPFPALVMDAEWTVVEANRGGQWLASLLLPPTWSAIDGQPLNLLELMAHPQGPVASMVNLAEVGPAVVAQLRGGALVVPSLAGAVARVTATIEGALGHPLPRVANGPVSAPALTTRYRTPHGELAFFSMYSTFGTPHDITLASLRVEHLFPADDHTRDVLHHALHAAG